MKLSTKGRYGLRALIDLAKYSEKEPVSISSIAARQGISERYLEQLMALLKKAGLVKSVRGAKRISPVFVMPEYRNRGLAQKAIKLAEEKHGCSDWELDTILEEKGNCYLYEKMG